MYRVFDIACYDSTLPVSWLMDCVSALFSLGKVIRGLI